MENPMRAWLIVVCLFFGCSVHEKRVANRLVEPTGCPRKSLTVVEVTSTGEPTTGLSHTFLYEATCRNATEDVFDCSLVSGDYTCTKRDGVAATWNEDDNKQYEGTGTSAIKGQAFLKT